MVYVFPLNSTRIEGLLQIFSFIKIKELITQCWNLKFDLYCMYKIDKNVSKNENYLTCICICSEQT